MSDYSVNLTSAGGYNTIRLGDNVASVTQSGSATSVPAAFLPGQVVHSTGSIAVGVSNPLKNTFGASSGTGVLPPGEYSQSYEVTYTDGRTETINVNLNVSEDPNWIYSDYTPPPYDENGFVVGGYTGDVPTGSSSSSAAAAAAAAEAAANAAAIAALQAALEQTIADLAATQQAITEGFNQIAAAETAFAAIIAAVSLSIKSSIDRNTQEIYKQTDVLEQELKLLLEELTRLLETKTGITVAEGIVGLGLLYDYWKHLGYISTERATKYEETWKKNEKLLSDKGREDILRAHQHVSERFIDATNHLGNPNEY